MRAPVFSVKWAVAAILRVAQLLPSARLIYTLPLALCRAPLAPPQAKQSHEDEIGEAIKGVSFRARINNGTRP